MAYPACTHILWPPVPAADGHYDVTLVSPRNYFLYTPLLPSSATGAVEPRSIVDPVRRHISDRVSACLGCGLNCTRWQGPWWACRRPGPPPLAGAVPCRATSSRVVQRYALVPMESVPHQH